MPHQIHEQTLYKKPTIHLFLSDFCKIYTLKTSKFCNCVNSAPPVPPPGVSRRNSRQAKRKPCLFSQAGSGGRGWIRTTEALSSRFTVCPHWPLGNTPLSGFDRLAAVRTVPGDLLILPQAARFVKRLFRAFLTFFQRGLAGFAGSRRRAGLPAYCIIPVGFCQRPISILFALRPRVWFCDKFFYSSCLFSGCIL